MIDDTDTNLELDTTPDISRQDTDSESKPKSRDWNAEAKAMGWNDSYDGADKVDAREYVLRKPLFDNIKSLKKKAKELEQAILSQRSIQEKLVEQQTRERMEKLTKDKIQAIEDGDSKKVLAIEQQMDEAKIAQAQVAQQVANPSPPAEYQEWLAKNKWYEEDEDMKYWAEAFAVQRKNKGDSPEEIFTKLSKKVREVFPTKFSNPNREAPPSVEGNTSRGNAGGRARDTSGDHYTETDIPRQYRKVFETFYKTGAYGKLSRKEAAHSYAAELAAIGEL